MVQVGLLLSDVPSSVPPAQQFNDVLRIVEAAQRNGFTYIAIGQHFLYGDLRWLQPVPLLARLAAEVDPHVRLVTQIMIAPLYHPVMLAEEIATLDVVTEGRLIFGAGLGYQAEEFDYLGVPYKTARRPVRRVPRADDPAVDRRTRSPSTASTGTLEDVQPHLMPGAAAAPADLDRRAQPCPARGAPAAYGDAYACPPETPLHEVVERYAIVSELRRRAARRSARSRCAATSWSPTPARRRWSSTPGSRRAATSPTRQRGLDVMAGHRPRERLRQGGGRARRARHRRRGGRAAGRPGHHAAGRPAAGAPAVADDGRRRDDRDDRPARPRRSSRPSGGHAADTTSPEAVARRRGACRMSRTSTPTSSRRSPTRRRGRSPTCCATTGRRAARRDRASSPRGGRDLDLRPRRSTAAERGLRRPLSRPARAQGDRVLIMAANSSQFVRTWWGTAVGGLVEVPINTAYEGEFLRHQVVDRRGRAAPSSTTFSATRFVAIARALRRDRAVLGHRHRRRHPRQGARARCARTAGRRRRGRSSSDGDRLELPTPRAAGPRRDLLHLRHDRPVQGRGDAARAAVLLRRRGRRRLTRLTAGGHLPDDHAAVPRQRAVHGGLPGARSPAAALVMRPKFSASRWIDQVRDSGVTVTNFVGVMMDFAWKQPPRDERRRQPAAGRVRRADGVSPIVRRSSRSATASRRSSRCSASPRPARRSCRRTASAAPAGAAGLPTSEWFDIRLVDPETDREVAGRRGRRARRAPEAPVDVQHRLLRHAGEDRRGVAQPVVPHRRRAAPRRGRLVLLRRPLQGRAAPARREHQLLRGRAGDPRAPGGRRVRGRRRRRPTQEAGEDEVLAVRGRQPSRSSRPRSGRGARAGSRRSRSRGSSAFVDALPEDARRRRSARRPCAGATAITSTAPTDRWRPTRTLSRDDRWTSRRTRCTRRSVTRSRGSAPTSRTSTGCEHDESKRVPVGVLQRRRQGRLARPDRPRGVRRRRARRHRGGDRRAGDLRVRRRDERLQRRPHRHLRLRADHPARQRGPEAALPAAAGQRRAAHLSFAVTEPDAGTDTTNISTFAKQGRRRLADLRQEGLDHQGAARPSGMLLLCRTSPRDAGRRSRPPA